MGEGQTQLTTLVTWYCSIAWNITRCKEESIMRALRVCIGMGQLPQSGTNETRIRCPMRTLLPHRYPVLKRMSVTAQDLNIFRWSHAPIFTTFENCTDFSAALCRSSIEKIFKPDSLICRPLATHSLLFISCQHSPTYAPAPYSFPAIEPRSASSSSCS